MRQPTAGATDEGVPPQDTGALPFESQSQKGNYRGVMWTSAVNRSEPQTTACVCLQVPVLPAPINVTLTVSEVSNFNKCGRCE